MTEIAILIACALACAAIGITVRGLCNQAREEGYSDGYRSGTYDALKTDLSAKSTTTKTQ